MNLILRIALSLVCLVPLNAQLSENLREAFRRIDSNEFRPKPSPISGAWLETGSTYQGIERNPSGGDQIVRYDPATWKREVFTTPEQLTPPQLKRPISARNYSTSTNGQVWLFAINSRPAAMRNTTHDYWLLDKSKNTWRKLGGANTNGLTNARLSPDGSKAAYVRANNLFIENLATGRIRQLTRDGSPTILNGITDWVYNEEFGLLEGFEWSPDSQRIAFLQFDERSVPEFALINYTDTLYPVITKYPYPKTGQTNPAVRLGIVNATGGKIRWIETGADSRDHYIPRIKWSPDSHSILFQHLNRLQNNNRFLLADTKTGKLREITRDQDEAWVDINERMIWLENGRRLLFTSERDGWNHAYSVSRDGKLRLITPQPFDLIQLLRVDEPGGWLFFTASPENATQSYLYRSSLDGSGKTERLTPASATGWNSYVLSPDCRYALHSHSRFDSPGKTDLIKLPTHEVVRSIHDDSGLREKVSTILKGRTEFVQVDVGEGIKLDGWMIRPTNFDATKKYPVVVHVYGEPYAQTVTDRWSGSTRLRHAALADAGYLVISFDNRGVRLPKGREWRKIIYGAVGELASREQAAALRALAVSQPYIDLTRVGVFGWSGGGSMTLNLLFRFPDLYHVGIAGAAVPDQTLYDSIYQERYMGLPQNNSEGYRDASPITHAQNLRGKLLIIHGTGDDNVHFQGTQRLLNKLIEHNKQFSFMEYPNRNHGIGGDHLTTLTYSFFEQNLPPGPR